MPTTQRYFFHYKTKTVCILIRNISVTVVDYAVDIFWNTARASLLLNETLTHFIAQSCAAQESMTGRYWQLLHYSMTNYIEQNRHVHNQILHNIIKSGNETCGFEDLLDNLNARKFLAISTTDAHWKYGLVAQIALYLLLNIRHYSTMSIQMIKPHGIFQFSYLYLILHILIHMMLCLLEWFVSHR